MKIITLLTLSTLFYGIAYSQPKTDAKLFEQIEIVKNIMRKDGLNNLDKIEGIYSFKTIEVTSGTNSSLGLGSLDGTTTRYIYAIISRNEEIANHFDIWEYSESDGQFLQRTTNWHIRKEGDKYFISCSDCSKKINGIDIGSIYHDKEILISGENILFTKYSTSKYNKSIYSNTYSTEKKIFPNVNGDNIYKTGTGFFITQNGYIVTNYHVIENATNVYASNSICNKLKAEIVFSDKLNDIAILKVNITLKPIPFNIITINKDIGSNVFTLGFPYVQSMGKDVKLTNGIINSSSGFENDTRYYQFSAEIQPGNSGGPLFDSDGNVVGLVSAKHNKATNAGYALKSKFIVDFIKLTNPTLLKKNVNTLKNLNLSSKYLTLKNYILLLEVE